MSSGPIPGENEIDTKLQQPAKNLFELDDVSRKILGYVACEGPSTIYELQRHKDLSKAAISRRLYGDAKLLSLLNEGYLRLEATVNFDRIKGRKKKFYGLTLKGFLASLANVACEKNYMFRIFLQICKDHDEWRLVQDKLTEKQRDAIIQKFTMRAKVDLAVFLQYHWEQGLTLTRIKHFDLYFDRFWNSVVPYGTEVDPFIPVNPASQLSQFGPDWKRLWEIRPQLDAKIPATIHVENWDGKTLKTKVRDYMENFPSEPWVITFPYCWITEKDLDYWPPHPDWGLVDALLVEYTDVTGKLRGAHEPPWDSGMLIYGMPLHEIQENWRRNQLNLGRALGSKNQTKERKELDALVDKALTPTRKKKGDSDRGRVKGSKT
jgi:hypothetical protein